MHIKPPHPWNVSPKQAIQLQKQLSGKIKTTTYQKPPQIIAGADISISKNSSKAFAGLVLLDFPSLRIINRIIHEGEVKSPYIPGLLSFREAPIL